MAVDAYNFNDGQAAERFMSASRKMTGPSTFGAMLRSKKSSSGAKNNNPNRQAGITRGGGHSTNKGLGGLHLNKTNRPVNTAKNKTKQVTRGGGRPSRRVVRTQTPLVRPES